MKKFFLLSTLFLFLINSGFSQGYAIKIKVNGVNDTTLMLGHHYGDKKFVVDTAEIGNDGYALFEGKDSLKRGIYIVVLPDKTYFDVLIDQDQEFAIETDTSNFVKNMKVFDSKENSEFLKYQLFMIDMQEKSKEYREKLDALKKMEGDHNAAIEKTTEDIKGINKQVQEYWKNIIENQSETLLAKLILLMKDVEIPDPPKDENGNIIDSLFQYKYYKAHYFDNIDFSDPAIIRTPVLHGKIEGYFTRMILQHPDSINKEADIVLKLAKANEDCYQYVLQYVFNKYTQSNIMGMDKVFVHLAENYYLSGTATWADTAFLRKIGERVVKLKPNLIGQKAVDLKLVTLDGGWESLYNIDSKFTVLYFWDPDCGHCKKETPKLHDLYQKYWDKGLEVFAVFTQVDKEKWETYINDNAYTDWINVYDPYNFTHFRKHYDIYSTPVAYLLNDKKEIIAKRVDVETLEKILEEELSE